MRLAICPLFVLLLPALALAQQPGRPGLLEGRPVRSALTHDAPTLGAPVTGQGLPAHQPAHSAQVPCPPASCPTAACAPPCCLPVCCDQVFCVQEAKSRTKVVYSSKPKDICLPLACCWFCFKHDDSCQPCECGVPKTVRTLVKKTVPDGDAVVCVPKRVSELPAPPKK